MTVFELDATTMLAADEMGMQVVHLSPQYQALRTSSGGATVRPFMPIFGAPDAGNVNARGPSASAELVFNPALPGTALVKLKGIVTSTGFFAAHEDDPATDGPFLPFPFATIQSLTEATTGPSGAPLYANGKAYTFVLVGDPESGAPADRSARVLGFPNQFTPPPAN